MKIKNVVFPFAVTASVLLNASPGRSQNDVKPFTDAASVLSAAEKVLELNNSLAWSHFAFSLTSLLSSSQKRNEQEQQLLQKEKQAEIECALVLSRLEATRHAPNKAVVDLASSELLHISDTGGFCSPSL